MYIYEHFGFGFHTVSDGQICQSSQKEKKIKAVLQNTTMNLTKYLDEMDSKREIYNGVMFK